MTILSSIMDQQFLLPFFFFYFLEDPNDNEELESAKALFEVAVNIEPTEKRTLKDQDDYICGEAFKIGSEAFILDDCENSPLLHSSVRSLLYDHKQFKNPMSREPIKAIKKILFI